MPSEQTSRIPCAPLQTEFFDSRNTGQISEAWVLFLTRNYPWVNYGTHAERVETRRPPKQPPSEYVGCLFFETEQYRKLWYQLQLDTNGFADWHYVFGEMSATQAQLAALATTLGTLDTGLLCRVRDYNHLLEWTGAAFEWGPLELGSHYYQMFGEGGPNPATGWQVCDGTATTRLNGDGTTTAHTVPNLAATPALPKLGIAQDGVIHAAVVPEIWGTEAGRTDVNTETVPVQEDPAGAAVDVADPAHYHTAHNVQPADTHPIPWTGFRLHYRR